VVNRRLRLALLLAALAATGPSAASPQAFHAPRAQVSITWLRVNPASRPQFEIQQSGLKTRLAGAQIESCATPDRVLPDAIRVHSLFQRPPPLHS